MLKYVRLSVKSNLQTMLNLLGLSCGCKLAFMKTKKCIKQCFRFFNEWKSGPQMILINQLIFWKCRYFNFASSVCMLQGYMWEKQPGSPAPAAALLGNVRFLVRPVLFIAVSIVCSMLSRGAGIVLNQWKEVYRVVLETCCYDFITCCMFLFVWSN